MTEYMIEISYDDAIHLFGYALPLNMLGYMQWQFSWTCCNYYAELYDIKNFPVILQFLLLCQMMVLIALLSNLFQIFNE